jgi:small subunit ribosomal protein S6
MRNYETITVFKPTLSDGDITVAGDKIKELITTNGGEVVRDKDWGVRQLAYIVEKERRGRYLYHLYQADPSAIAEIERNLRLMEPCMKYLTVKLDELPPEPTKKVETAETPESAESETPAAEA